MAQNQNRLLKLLLALCIFRLWIMPLPSSFWVDETGTMFVVRQGPQHPSLAVVPQVPASVYYWLPRAMDRLLPFLPYPEVLYRLPSVLAMALALFIIGRIASHLIHPRAAWFAVFACLALSGFNYEAGNARPYALGILVVSASALFLIRWLDRGRFLDAALFVICAALIWRVHLLFWPFYIVLVFYALIRRARWRAALIIFGLVGVFLIPVFFDALSLSRQAAAHVMAPVPPPKELFRELKLGLIAVTLGIALVLRIRGGAGALACAGPPRPALSLILLWWLIPPLALYAFSALTGNSVFVHRYLSFGLPGAALAATAAAALFLPEKRWTWGAAILGAGVLLVLGDWRHPSPPHHNSNWRAAAAAINSLPNEPVLCPSPFLEARPPAWSPGYPLPGFLYAHLAAYPVNGRLILFPFQTSPAAEQWASQLDLGPQFVIYGQAPSVEFWRNWFLKQPRFSDWSSRKLGEFGDVDAIVLAAPK